MGGGVGNRSVFVSQRSKELSMASLQYRTLIKATPKMTEVISGDPLTVAEKLFAKELVAPAAVSQAQNIALDARVKASSLVSNVLRMVKSFPENYEAFLEVLSEVPLKQLVDDIRNVYSALEAEDQVCF